jgi:hypothetical protein
MAGRNNFPDRKAARRESAVLLQKAREKRDRKERDSKRTHHINFIRVSSQLQILTRLVHDAIYGVGSLERAMADVVCHEEYDRVIYDMLSKLNKDYGTPRTKAWLTDLTTDKTIAIMDELGL